MRRLQLRSTKRATRGDPPAFVTGSMFNSFKRFKSFQPSPYILPRVAGEERAGGLNGAQRLNGLNVLNQHRLANHPELERSVKISDLTVTGTTCETPMGLPMSM